MPVALKHLRFEAIEKSPEIGAWLSHFPSSNQSTAKSLLIHLNFVARDDYSNWLLSALQSLPAAEPCAIYAIRKFPDHKELWDNDGNVINRPGTTLGSEDLVYSLVANAVRSHSTYFDHPSLTVLRDQRIHNVVLIDDSIGSGKRVSDFIKSMMMHKSFRSWWSFGFIAIKVLAFARTRESEKRIIHDIPGSDHSIRKHPVSSKIRFVSDIVYGKEWLASRWGQHYQAILHLCDSETRIAKNRRRGFGDVMGNIIFYHSVPNNIPGVMWFQNDKWQPLFPGRSVPDWLPALLEDGRSVSTFPEDSPSSDSLYSQLSEKMINLLSLIKSGVRRASSLALRMDCELEFVNSMIQDALNSGLVSKNMRLTEVAIDVLRRLNRRTNVLKWERSLYVPRSWCADRATVQPLVLGEATPCGQADPAEVSTSAGGEAGQVSLERSDAKAASPPLSVRPQLPSKSRKGPDSHGPLDSKER